MKKILVISHCPMRGNSTGLTGRFMSLLGELNRDEFQISLFDTDISEGNHVGSNYNAYHYYCLPQLLFNKITKRIPKISMFYWNSLAVWKLKKIIKKEKFDIIILYPVHLYVDVITSIVHKSGGKIIFMPWGSEVLRAKGAQLKRLQNAYENLDLFVGKEKGNLVESAKKFGVPETKIRTIKHELPVLGVQRIIELRGKFSREEMSKSIGIPFALYNIVCGYNPSPAQRHRKIIDSIWENKAFLPQGYQLVFPFTYGFKQDYKDELEDYCRQLGLNAVFLSEYMTDEQMAYLHLITDLFIEVQPTDNGNMFMVEALFAENQIVTGKWLNYKLFEQYGIPYHLIDQLDELPDMLHGLFTGDTPKVVIPSLLIEDFYKAAMTDNKVFWEEIFREL